MKPERKEWAQKLMDSMKRCADPKMPCDTCVFDHICDRNEEGGADIMVTGANMIQELLQEVTCLETVNSHLKTLALMRQSDGGEPSTVPQEGAASKAGAETGWDWQIDLYEKAIDKFSVKKQITKAIEELNELGVELARVLLNDGEDERQLSNLREELADVCIMCDQLQLIFGDISDWEMYKLERLERKVARGV